MTAVFAPVVPTDLLLHLPDARKSRSIDQMTAFPKVAGDHNGKSSGGLHRYSGTRLLIYTLCCAELLHAMAINTTLSTLALF